MSGTNVPLSAKMSVIVFYWTTASLDASAFSKGLYKNKTSFDLLTVEPAAGLARVTGLLSKLQWQFLRENNLVF